MSFWELMIILIVALIVIKPERLPELCYFAGKTLARLRTIIDRLREGGI